jgi:polar amino acid transport system substrate-binding protein
MGNACMRYPTTIGRASYLLPSLSVLLTAFHVSLLTLFLSFLVFAPIAHGQPRIIYTIPNVNWEPYWIVDEGEEKGILSDVLKAIGVQAKYELEPTIPLPVKRAQKTFYDGDADIECCINISWREANDSGGATLWSDPIISTEEVLIFPASKSFGAASTKDLSGKKIATILGYGYDDDDKFIRSDTLNNIAQLTMVSNSRADAGIVDRFEIQYLLKQNAEVREMAAGIEFGPTLSTSDLRIRIHSSKPELLEPINAAIQVLKENGTIEEIVNRYVQ